MKPHRWPALVLIPIVLAGAVVIDRGRDDVAPVADGRDRTRTLEEQGLMPVAAPSSALGATWYCAGGTVGPDTEADHTVIVANPSDDDLVGTITVYAGSVVVAEEAGTDGVVPTDDEGASTTSTSTTTTSTTSTVPVDEPAPVTMPIEVAANTTIEVRLAEIGGVAEGYAAALVELNGGEAVVEHRIEGSAGTDVSSCSSAASPTWYFAAGATTKDAVETLVFFNPFPDDAVVDVSFRTEQDVRTPEQYEGLVIPGQSVVAAPIGDVVTRREHVSVSVIARSGRLVVDRIQSYDGTEGPAGLTVTLGAPVPATTWFFPEGTVGDGVEERMVIYNPTQERAEVDLEIVVDDPDLTGEVEPFELTVPPEGYEEINLNDEARITSARGGEGGLSHASVVRSVNDVPIVAERILIGGPDSAFPGVDITLGAPLLATEVVLAAGASEEADEAVVVFNVSNSDATVTGTTLDNGDRAPVDGLDGVTVAAGERLVVLLSGSTDPGSLVVSSDHPVVVERRLVFDGDMSGAIAVPVAGSLSEPPN